MLKNLLGGSVIALVVAVGAYFGFRGDNEVVATPTPEPTAEVTATMSATVTQEPTATATTLPTATPEPTPTLEAGRKPAAAPIESVDVEIQDSPPQYVVVIVAGLPNGCAKPYAQDVSREDDVFIVTIQNSVPDGRVLCTDIFRTYEVRVTIDATLEAGHTYTVRANDKETTFTAK